METLELSIVKVKVKVTQSCPTLCDPVDCSLPGSSVLGSLQARVLEWVAVFLLQGIFLTQGSNPHLLHWQEGSFPLSHQGSPRTSYWGLFILLLISLHPPFFKLGKKRKQRTNKSSGYNTPTKCSRILMPQTHKAV